MKLTQDENRETKKKRKANFRDCDFSLEMVSGAINQKHKQISPDATADRRRRRRQQHTLHRKPKHKHNYWPYGFQFP